MMVVELDNYNCSLLDRSLVVAMVHWSQESPLVILKILCSNKEIITLLTITVYILISWYSSVTMSALVKICVVASQTKWISVQTSSDGPRMAYY